MEEFKYIKENIYKKIGDNGRWYYFLRTTCPRCGEEMFVSKYKPALLCRDCHYKTGRKGRPTGHRTTELNRKKLSEYRKQIKELENGTDKRD